jgi:hypothetical protein
VDTHRAAAVAIPVTGQGRVAHRAEAESGVSAGLTIPPVVAVDVKEKEVAAVDADQIAALTRPIADQWRVAHRPETDQPIATPETKSTSTLSLPTDTVVRLLPEKPLPKAATV